MSHNRQRARAARAARVVEATQATVMVVPTDPTAELPVYGALLGEVGLPDPDEFVIPDFVPWDDLLPPRPPRVVGTATSENRIVPVDDTAYTVQDAAALLDLLAGNTQQVPAVPGESGLLGLTVPAMPQRTEVWR